MSSSTNLVPNLKYVFSSHEGLGVIELEKKQTLSKKLIKQYYLFDFSQHKLKLFNDEKRSDYNTILYLKNSFFFNSEKSKKVSFMLKLVVKEKKDPYYFKAESYNDMSYFMRCLEEAGSIFQGIDFGKNKEEFDRTVYLLCQQITFHRNENQQLKTELEILKKFLYEKGFNKEVQQFSQKSLEEMKKTLEFHKNKDNKIDKKRKENNEKVIEKVIDIKRPKKKIPTKLVSPRNKKLPPKKKILPKPITNEKKEKKEEEKKEETVDGGTTINNIFETLSKNLTDETNNKESVNENTEITNNSLTEKEEKEDSSFFNDGNEGGVGDDRSSFFTKGNTASFFKDEEKEEEKEQSLDSVNLDDLMKLHNLG